MVKSSSELVLVTGGTGYLGSAVVLAFASRGHAVRSTTRCESKAKAWGEKHPAYKDVVEWKIVDDIARDGALDRVLDGCTRVVHTASPFHFNIQSAADLIVPAVKGTEAILQACSHHKSVRSLVVTSSTAAVFDRTKGFRPGYTYSEKDWNPCNYEEAMKETNPILSYVNSKTLAEKAVWEFKSDRHFSITTLCPSVILGPAYQPTTRNEVNCQSLKLIWGLVGADAVPPTFAPTFVDVRDCALAHYQAAFAPAAAEKRYLVIGGTFDNATIAETMKRQFPAEAHRIPDGGKKVCAVDFYKYDVSSIEKDLGILWTSLEKSVTDAAAQFFEQESTLS